MVSNGSSQTWNDIGIIATGLTVGVVFAFARRQRQLDATADAIMKLPWERRRGRAALIRSLRRMLLVGLIVCVAMTLVGLVALVGIGT